MEQGDQQVINPEKIDTLSGVNINGNVPETITSNYGLGQTENTIILTFKEGLNDCTGMFIGTKIKEIYFQSLIF